MATAENIAIERRVRVLERAIGGRALVYVRTTIVVYEREPEPDYLTFEEIKTAAQAGPRVREVRRIPDLELLIDPVRRTRRLRHKLSLAGQQAFDRIKVDPRVKLIDIEIPCHEKQVGAILSDAPIVGALGSNRSGKTRMILWWLLRRVLLRGGPPAPDGTPRAFWFVGPRWSQVIENGLWGIAGPNAMGGGLWPDELFVELRKQTKTSKEPQLTLIDGSVILFKHAHHTGQRAGGNLKSANVVDAVVDELGEIQDDANWFQVLTRVSQQAGHVGTASTRVRGHWMGEALIDRAKDDSSIDLREFTIWDNPWYSEAMIWSLIVGLRKAFSAEDLERHVLPLPKCEQWAAARDLVTDPRVLREDFGVETETSIRLWPEWRDSMIYAGTATRHPTIDVWRDKPVRLLNITREVMAQKWPRATQEGRSAAVFAGLDFNVRGHAVLLELFGEGTTPAAALANRDSWTVLVVDEVQVDGTTLELAKQLKLQADGPCPVWYDPHTGAGHAARGSAGTTDAAILRRDGFDAAPANGTNKQGAPRPLGQIESRNVMHGLMRSGRFYVHERCRGFIEAMVKEKAKPDGRVDKRSSPNSPSDYLSGFSDSGRYALWPVFRSMFAPVRSKDNE